MKKYTYIVRVQIPNGVIGEYTKLKNILVQAGFTKIIVAKDGTKWQLPTGNYLAVSTKDPKEIRDIVLNAANMVKRKCMVLVTQSSGDAWANLPQA